LIRILRTVLALEGLVISMQTYRQTRKLEERSEAGDLAASGAVALTPQGRLFNIPNGLTASAYFAVVALLSVTGLLDRSWVRKAAVTISWLSLGVSGFLVFSLLFVLRRNCPLCIRAHALNLALTLAVNARAGRLDPPAH